MKLVPLKVAIRLGEDGKHKYPDFNSLEASLRDNLDFAYYFDKHGGWFYDQLSGFGEEDEFNPDPSVWYGVVLVPKKFADAAVAAFPIDIEKMSAAEVESFYDSRVTVRDPQDHLDTNELLGIEARVRLETALGITPSPDLLQRRADALNPDHPQIGVRKNMKKKFKDLKSAKGFTIGS